MTNNNKNTNKKDKKENLVLSSTFPLTATESSTKRTLKEIAQRMEQIQDSLNPKDIEEHEALAAEYAKLSETEPPKKATKQETTTGQLSLEPEPQQTKQYKQSEIDKARKYMIPYPQPTQPKHITITQDEALPYVCSKCGQRFKLMHELGSHVRHEQAQERREKAGGLPLSEFPKRIPKHYKIIKVEHMKQSTRIISTIFIPSSWNIVKVYKPVKKDGGRWVYFEPLQKGDD